MEEEMQELATLLSYPPIARSLNLARMLSFVCEKYFEGRPEEIRESSIAIHALGRKEMGFDSHADPIVRVTARILRKRLDAFYETEGRFHILRLVLPIGQYVPQFVRVENIPEIPLDSLQPGEGEEEALAEHCNGLPNIAAARESDGASLPRITSLAGQVLHFSRKRLLQIGIVIGTALFLVSGISFWAGRSTAFLPNDLVASSIAWGKPVWSDNFSGASGAAPDPLNWAYDTGNSNGWGNKEIEVYCAFDSNVSPCDASHPNASQDGNGHLVLRAMKTHSGSWTSARIRSLKEFQYGRIEARMKLPVGAGLWPAFWMIGSNYGAVDWPECGSVDFMENVFNPKNSSNLGPSSIRSTIHGPGYFGGNGIFENFFFPNGGRVDDGFHVYGVIWSPNMIQFYVDDPANVFFVRTASDIPAGARWVFNNPFRLVFNLAVGGQWPGSPDESTPNPSGLLIDYVRVYKIPQVPGPVMKAEPVILRTGSSGGTMLSLSSRGETGRVYLSCSGAPVNTSCSLATHVADFTNSPKQEVGVSISTGSITGTQQYVTPLGDYALTVTAQTMSGATSSVVIPLRVR
jgi:beta-glucanase (GH16 family)